MSAWSVITAGLSALSGVWEIGDAAAGQGDSDDAGAGSVDQLLDPAAFDAFKAQGLAGGH
jgi:hypothetical protein